MPEPGDGAEGGDERLLGGVLRRLRRAQHPQANAVDLALVGEHQRVEGVEVAALAPLDE